MAQEVCCLSAIAEDQVHCQARPCWICGGQSVTVKVFPPSNSAFPSQYHSSNAPYIFISHRRCITLPFDSVINLPTSGNGQSQ